MNLHLDMVVARFPFVLLRMYEHNKLRGEIPLEPVIVVVWIVLWPHKDTIEVALL